MVDTPGFIASDGLLGYWPPTDNHRHLVTVLLDLIDMHDTYLFAPKSADLGPITVFNTSQLNPITAQAMMNLVDSVDEVHDFDVRSSITLISHPNSQLRRDQKSMKSYVTEGIIDSDPEDLATTVSHANAKIVLFQEGHLEDNHLITDPSASTTDDGECFARIIIPLTRSRGTAAWASGNHGQAAIDWNPGSVVLVMNEPVVSVAGEGTMLAVCLDMVGEPTP